MAFAERRIERSEQLHQAAHSPTFRTREGGFLFQVIRRMAGTAVRSQSFLRERTERSMSVVSEGRASGLITPAGQRMRDTEGCSCPPRGHRGIGDFLHAEVCISAATIGEIRHDLYRLSSGHCDARLVAERTGYLRRTLPQNFACFFNSWLRVQIGTRVALHKENAGLQEWGAAMRR